MIYPNYPITLDNGELNVDSNTKLVVYRDKSVENNSEFKGMFFVKIASDIQSEKYLMPVQDGFSSYEIKNTLPAHYFSDTAAVPAGVTGTTQSSNQTNGNDSVGRTNSRDEWVGLLDFGGAGNSLFPANHTFSGNQIGGFFIDKAFIRGTHTSDFSGDYYGGQFDIDDDQAYGPRSGDGRPLRFGKGIYEENGKHFVEISFSEIGEKAWTESDEEDHSPAFGSSIAEADFNEDAIWQPGNNPAAIANYSVDYSAKTNELKELISKLTKNSQFKIKSDDDLANIYTIKSFKQEKRYNFFSWKDLRHFHTKWITDPGALNLGLWNQNYDNSEYKTVWREFGKPYNRRVTYTLELSHSLNDVKIGGKDILHNDNVGSSRAVSFQFLEQRYTEGTKIKVSENPAIWETEPKETADLDIYYEASEAIPLQVNEKNNERFIPKGSIVTCPARPATISNSITYVTSWDNNKISFNLPIDLDEYLPAGKPVVRLIFTRPDDTYTTIVVDKLATLADTTLAANTYIVNTNVSKNPFALSWYNCFSFNNGVESNRIRDDFNQVTIDKGAKASVVLEENYEEERRSSGLIYSGIYNSNSGVNNLNQFIQAEKITKDLNPTYGSIQKLYARGGDLVAFCEDRIIKILANKDALFNADGNSNLVSTNRVLGEAVPFSGEYGISKNPESFAAENYRAYFTDKQRGAVLRLSMDGLTPISAYGMDDYFKDHLKLSEKLIGSYDDKKDNYNITILDIEKTISYEEKVRGWSSFKSFVSESYGLSMANDYYTFEDGLIWRHHSNNPLTKRNTFYGRFVPSSVSTLLNDASDIVKTYKTINYEGSQSNVNLEATSVSSGYYNLRDIDGWSAESIVTNLQEGYVSEFIKKEDKWFNYIKGNDVSETLDIKTNEFSFQGIGKAESIDLDPSLFVQSPPVLIPGCMDPLADNYDPNATTDNGSCTYTTPIYGCTDPRATNYDPNATIDDNSCVMGLPGCTDPRATNYNPNATVDDGSCFMSPNPPVYGCTDPRALNYDINATIDNGTCIMGIQGCTDPLADNYNPLANQDDGTCTYSTGIGPNPGGPGSNPNANGCTDPIALNYNSSALVDDGSCIYPNLTIQDTNDDD